MIIDLNYIFKDYEDKVVTEEVREQVTVNGQSQLKISRKPMTLRSILIQAINENSPGEQRDVNDLVMADGLNVKIYDSKDGKIDITSSDMEFLENRVIKIIPYPIVYRRIKEIFKEVSEKK